MRKRFLEVLMSAREAIKGSPVEMALSLVYTIISLWILWGDPTSADVFACAVLYSPIFMLLSFALNNVFDKSRGELRMIYFASIALPILYGAVFGYDEFFIKNNLVEFLLINTSALLFAVMSRRASDNARFAANAHIMGVNCVASLFIAYAALSIVCSIILSLSLIFGFGVGYKIYFTLLIVAGTLLSPLFFFGFEHRENRSQLPTMGGAMQVVINYIMTPAVVIYGVILYLYFAKIVVIWTLPEGIISYISSLFFFLAITTSVYRRLLAKRIFDVVFRYIGYLSIPAAVMFWVAILYRIFEYGFTTPRCIVLFTVVLVTMWVVCSIVDRWLSYLRIFAVASMGYLTIGVGSCFVADREDDYPFDGFVQSDEEEPPQPVRYRDMDLRVRSAPCGDVETMGYRRVYFSVDKKVVGDDYIFTNSADNVEICRITKTELYEKLFGAISAEQIKELGRQNRDLVFNHGRYRIALKSIDVEARGRLESEVDSEIGESKHEKPYVTYTSVRYILAK